MAASVVITVETARADVAHLVTDDASPRKEARALAAFFQSMAAGQTPASVSVQTASAAPAAASGTFTLASAVATDAITIGTTTFTATSTPTLSTDWEIDGADDTADAASLAAAINAHATVSQIVTASSADEVVTITAKQAGVVGNFIPISSADATITASGSFLTGGTGGATDAPTTYNLGVG